MFPTKKRSVPRVSSEERNARTQALNDPTPLRRKPRRMTPGVSIRILRDNHKNVLCGAIFLHYRHVVFVSVAGAAYQVLGVLLRKACD